MQWSLGGGGWLVVALTFRLSTRTSQGNSNCVTGPEPTKGACYWKVTTPLGWKDALKTCQDAGGTLAMVKSADIHSFLNTAGLLSGPVWLGGSCGLVLGVWRWADTEAFTWERWHGSQPDGPKNAESRPCVYFSAGNWYDSVCWTSRNFLCQSEPAPCSHPKKCITTAVWDITKDQCLGANWFPYSNVPLTRCQQLCRESVIQKCKSFKYSSATQDCVINKVGIQTGATLSSCPGWDHYERAEPVPSVIPSCYKVFNMGGNMNGAKSNCASEGMELVKIDSEAENDHISTLTTIDSWFSLSDVGVVSTFKYSDGTYPQWSNWGNGKPLDKSSSTSLHFVKRLGNGEWEARSNGDWTNNHVCEKTRATSCDAAASVPGASKTVDYQLSVVVYTCNPGWAFSDGSLSRYVTCHCDQAGMDADVTALGECTELAQPTTTLPETTTTQAFNEPTTTDQVTTTQALPTSLPSLSSPQDTTTADQITESETESTIAGSPSTSQQDSTTVQPDSTTQEVITLSRENSVISESITQSTSEKQDSTLTSSTTINVMTDAASTSTEAAEASIAGDPTTLSMPSIITNLPYFGGDLEWDVWTPWTECTHPCGPLGRHYRIKLCSDQHAHDCQMSLATREGDKIYYHIGLGSCNSAPCSIDGAWSEWSNWAECSATCGEGTRRRSRSCDGPPPQYGGATCGGGGNQAISCSTNVTCKVVSPQVEDGPIFTEADSRPSAQGIGSIEVALVLGLLLALVIMDIGKCHRDSKWCISNIRGKRRLNAAK